MAGSNEKTTWDDAALDALFADVARDGDVAPGEAFLSKLIDDAEALQPGLAVAGGAIAEAPARRAGLYGWISALGGWPALGGVAAAGVAGLWVGLAPPEIVDSAIAGLVGESVTIDLTGFSDPYGIEG